MSRVKLTIAVVIVAAVVLVGVGGYMLYTTRQVPDEATATPEPQYTMTEVLYIAKAGIPSTYGRYGKSATYEAHLVKLTLGRFYWKITVQYYNQYGRPYVRQTWQFWESTGELRQLK